MWQGNNGENEDCNSKNWGGETVYKSHGNFHAVTQKSTDTASRAGSWVSTLTHGSLPFSVQAGIQNGALNHNHTASSAESGEHSHTCYHNHTASSDEAGSHTHIITVSNGGGDTSTAGMHVHIISVVQHDGNTSTTGSHTHTIPLTQFTTGKASGYTGLVGSGTEFNIEPAYYKLVFIMRIS